VRNHGGIPEIEEDAYFFDVEGLVNKPRRITLKELKDESIFPRQTNVVTIQCSGTRRIEQIHEYPGDGDELINAPVRNLNLLIGTQGISNVELDYLLSQFLGYLEEIC
jgi:sulfite oxidase